MTKINERVEKTIICPNNGDNIAVVYVAQSGNMKVAVVRETVGGAVE